ncbi:MAG: Ig-like domain-containing protein [Bacilli bacterium]
MEDYAKKGMKKIMLLFVVIFGLITVAGCQEFVTTTDATISVENANLVLEVGDEFNLIPRVEGLNVAPQFSFVSSDTTVFTVSSNGLIIAVGPGIGFLNINLLNGTAPQLKLTVEVVEEDATSGGEDNPIEDNPTEDTYTIANGDINIEVGQEVVLQVLKGSSLYTGAITWLSNNAAAATVDANGTVRGVEAGNAKIIAVINGKPMSIDVVVRVKSVVTISPTSLIINGSNFVNTTDSIILTATPNQGAIVGGLTWKSSDDTKATVNNFGIVTGVSTGIVTITASLSDDLTVFGTFTLFVKELETSASPITSITLSGASEVLVGNKAKLNVSYTPADEPASFKFTSSNASIATVDANGWVTGVAGGSVQITASLIGDPDKKAIFNVTVIPLPASIAITGAANVGYGQNILLTAVVSPLGANSTVIWSTNNASVATVDVNGRVTGIAEGTATITATSIVSASIKATHNITVTDPKSITLNPSSLALGVGSNQTIIATVVAASLTDKSVVWSSGNPAVATVDANGKVTAVAVGSTTIIAKLNADNSTQAQATVTVTEAPLPVITISASSASIAAGTTKTLTATVTNTTNTAVTWTSSNTSVATVNSSGVVSGVAAGSAVITATSVANNSVSATCAITVTAQLMPELTVSPTSGSIYVGEPLQITATVTNVSNTAVTWTSSNTGIATVSSTGVVTGKAAGSATITVTSVANTSVKKTVAITVKAVPSGTIILSAEPGASLKVGATGYQIYVRDTAGTALSRLECTFITSDASVATVSAYGTISALKVGNVVITAIHSKGKGTIAIAVVSSTTVTGLVGTYNEGSRLAYNSLGYGVEHSRYSGTTKYTSSGSLVSQRVSVLTVDTSRRAKVVVWTRFSSASRWSMNQVATLAANYESNHSSWKVLAAINADFYDIWPRGALAYQTMGTIMIDTHVYKSTVTSTTDFVSEGSDTNYKTLGFPNDGTANSIIQGTPTKALKLRVYNSSGTQVGIFDVTGRNSNPGTGAVSVFYATYNSSHAAVARSVSKPSSGKLFVVGTGVRVLANSGTDFYGRGPVSNANASSASLGENQFAIASNNATLNNLVANGYTLKVQYEFSGAFAGIREATNATRGFILNAAAVDAQTCINSRSDMGARHPRSMIGRRADGTIVIVAADGRQTNMSGVRVEEMQAIMAKYGCVQAHNMDGGGSTRLMIRTGSSYGTTASFTAANSPSENRSVTSVVLVVAPR